MSTDPDKVGPNGEPTSQPQEPTDLIKHPEVDSTIEEIIDAVPEEKKEPIRHLIRETLVGLVERSSGPQISPEVAKILAASADKESDHKFEFLIEKQRNEEAKDVRNHDFRIRQHDDRVKILRPAFYFALFILASCTAVGILLCYVGNDVLGASLITAVWAGALGFLAGFGTSDFFKDKS
jgi:hypothetical protein